MAIDNLKAVIDIPLSTPRATGGPDDDKYDGGGLLEVVEAVRRGCLSFEELSRVGSRHR